MRIDSKIAFLGYGRFGAALGERLIDAGAEVRAYDPTHPPPAAVAASLAQAIEGADHVVLAVPVATMAVALAVARPHLTAEQLVLDVGSVKSGPSAVMSAELGRDIPWIATHPLFGPTSLALGERPLRVVVCPNAAHPEATARAARLFEAIGCEIVEQDAESHDRQMAEGHALAYFVAKGFLDAGIDLDTPLAPPSVRAIARAVEAVREDAAHLFASLHRENPYATPARQRLLDAMHATDEALRAPVPLGEQAHEETGVLHIDDYGEASPKLREARDVIDEIDGELIELLARRAGISLRAAAAKAEAGRAIRDPNRELRLLEARREHAARLQLDEDAVSEIFESILRFSRRHQTDNT